MKKAIFLALGGIAHRRKSMPKNVFKLAMKNLSCPRVTFWILQDKLNIKKRAYSKPGNCITVNSATSDMPNIVKFVSDLPFKFLEFSYL